MTSGVLGDAKVAPSVTPSATATADRMRAIRVIRSGPWSQKPVTTGLRRFTFFLSRPLYDSARCAVCCCLCSLLSLVFAGQAGAAEVVLPDNEGRSIRFDVHVEGVDAEWYAALLRAAPHRDEISTVRVDIVSWDELRATCGSDAAGCYARNVMVVPAEQSDENAIPSCTSTATTSTARHR